MHHGMTVKDNRCSDTLADLERTIRAAPYGAELVRKYFDEAVSENKGQAATRFFEEMLENHPQHNQVRILLISLYLQNGQYHMAMKAIEALLSYTSEDEGLIDSALAVRQKIGPMKAEKGAGLNPTLCVCMIVKDEQAFLGPCLHAIKPVADEIIVVDTGSTDRSADIARVFGARVYDYIWKDDFSAARNYGLERASAEWVLIMDADEAMDASDQKQLKEMIADRQNPLVAYSIETRNYTHISNALNWQANSGQYPQHETGIGWFPSRKIRLFPNNPVVRFRYPVHELVDASIREAGMATVNSDIPIHHYGHLNEKKNREKAEHYFKMGYAKLHQLGDDVAALRELAVQAGQLECWVESIDLWRRLLDVRPGFKEAYVNMSGAHWQLGNYREALDAAKSALVLNVEYKEAVYNYAVSLLLLGRAKEAADTLTDLCHRVPNYLGAQFMLAVSRVCAGDSEKGNTILRHLAKSMKSAVIELALQDLIKRMHNSNNATCAVKIDESLAALELKDK